MEMEKNATVQQNKGFIMRPYSFFKAQNGRAPSSAETIVEGLIYSFEVAEKACKMGYSRICERFGLSRSTLSRKVKCLTKKGSISVKRNGQGCSQYTYELDASKKIAHVRTEDAFFTAQFKIKEKNGEEYERKLKLSEIDVLSLIYTHTWDGKSPFVGSHKEIAALLGGYAEETICRAVSVLKKARLVSHKLVRNGSELEHHFNVKMKTLHKYGITRRDLREERRAEKKAEKEKQAEEQKKNAFVTKHIQDIDAKADRERFYQLRRESAVKAAEGYLAKANKDERFKGISCELSRIEPELAKAELREPGKLPSIQSRKAMLLKERRAILARLGIEESKLKEETHYKCKKCSDTGFLPNGTQCNCYKPGGKP